MRAPTDVRYRLLKLAERLFTGGTVTARYVMETFGVSRSTAHRDLVVLEAVLPVYVDQEKPHNGLADDCVRKTLRLMRGRTYLPLVRAVGSEQFNRRDE